MASWCGWVVLSTCPPTPSFHVSNLSPAPLGLRSHHCLPCAWLFSALDPSSSEQASVVFTDLNPGEGDLCMGCFCVRILFSWLILQAQLCLVPQCQLHDHPHCSNAQRVSRILGEGPILIMHDSDIQRTLGNSMP